MERALANNRGAHWPLITLNLDFKTDERSTAPWSSRSPRYRAERDLPGMSQLTSGLVEEWITRCTYQRLVGLPAACRNLSTLAPGNCLRTRGTGELYG